MATNEGLVLDGTDLNSTSGAYATEEIAFPPPRKRQEWAQSGDSDGAALIRDPLFENREITAKVRIQNQASMDAALAAIGTLVAKLEEAEKQEDGLPLVWTPAQSTKSYTLYVLSGEVDDIPIDVQSGYFVSQPVLTLRMTAKPFGYGAEVASLVTVSSSPLVEVTIPATGGDVPAEGRLIVGDNSAQARRHIEWGLENRYYNAATQLLLDSDSLATAEFNGTQTTRAGAYDPNGTGSNVVRSTMIAAPSTVVGTGNQAHIGTFRVKARVFTTTVSTSTFLRFRWQSGDGEFRSNSWTSPQAGGVWTEVDLGTITIPETRLGTQRWTGHIEAYTTANAGSDTIDVDYLLLIPAGEGYGKGDASLAQSSVATAVARDEFNQTSGSLNTKALPLGGTWATSGATTDFTINTTSAIAERSTTSDSGQRSAIAGSTSYAATDVRVTVNASAWPSSQRAGVIARWTDVNNYVNAYISQGAFRIERFVAGAVVTVAETSAVSLGADQAYWIRLVIDTAGSCVAYFSPVSGGPTLSIAGSDTALATGGTIATGKPGIVDANPTATASTRRYDDFVVVNPAANVVINSGRQAEIRSDSSIRQDTTGVYWGTMPGYRGSRFLLPPAGDENRTSRIAVKARRDPITDSVVSDSLTVQVRFTPRYLVVPR